MLVTPHWPLWPPPIDPSVSQPQQSVNTSASTDSTGSNRMTASSTNRAKRTGKPLPTLPAMSRKHWPPFFASFWFWGSSLIEPNENSLKQQLVYLCIRTWAYLGLYNPISTSNYGHALRSVSRQFCSGPQSFTENVDFHANAILMSVNPFGYET